MQNADPGSHAAGSGLAEQGDAGGSSTRVTYGSSASSSGRSTGSRRSQHGVGSSSSGAFWPSDCTSTSYAACCGSSARRDDENSGTGPGDATGGGASSSASTNSSSFEFLDSTKGNDTTGIDDGGGFRERGEQAATASEQRDVVDVNEGIFHPLFPHRTRV